MKLASLVFFMKPDLTAWSPRLNCDGAKCKIEEMESFRAPQ